MLSNTRLAVVDGDGAVEGDPGAHGLTGQGPGDAVAIAADLDVGIPLCDIAEQLGVHPRSTGPSQGARGARAISQGGVDRLMRSSTGMPCRELAELVTAYLDGALPGAERARCDGHLRTCPGCRGYVAQMELVVSALGELRRADGEENPAEKARLLDLFRTRGPHSRAPLERSVPLGIADAYAAPGVRISVIVITQIARS
jgi:hypothetical protein